jgi:hypothetical protein
MKPSSKICLKGLVAAAALWISIGGAASAGHFVGARGGFHPRPGMAHAAHAPHVGSVESGLDGRRHRRLSQAGFGYGWPYDFDWSGSGPGPYDGPNPGDGDVRGPLIVPAFYIPPGYLPPGTGPYAACSAPRIIHVGTQKPVPHLPRVVYGTPSACPN